MQVQSGLGSYFLLSLGCEGGSCAGCGFPGMRLASAGVWDGRSLQEGGREGFDNMYLVFPFLFFSSQKASSDDKLNKVRRQLKDWQGWLGGKFSTGQDVLT